MQSIFDFYEDPSHGWLKVPKALLRELGIADKISEFSYVRGDFAYLEEDCDAPLFDNTMIARGIQIKWNIHIADKTSKIRNYESYDRLVNYPIELLKR
jgi:hypothetical protein